MRRPPASLVWLLLAGTALSSACLEDESEPGGPAPGSPASPDRPGGAGGPATGALPILGPGRDPNTALPRDEAAPIGSACMEPSDCAAGLCLAGASSPGGYCSKNCGGAIFAGSEACPSGSACVRMNEATAACLDLCGPNDGPCRDGYVCGMRDGLSVCVAPCSSNRECGAAASCNSATGLCEAGGSRPPGRNGDACLSNGDCASNACITEQASMGVFAGGYCVQTCTAAEVNRPCADSAGGGVCTALDTTTFACLGACQTGVDCRSAYLCSADPDLMNPTAIGMCLPRCGRYQCKEGSTCDPSTGICVAGGATSTPPLVERVDLGLATFSSPPAVGDVKSIPIDVAAGTTSFSVLARPSSDSRVLFGKLLAPNGQVIMDVLDPANSPMRVPVRSFPGTFALIYPNAPRLNLVPGRYQLLLWGQGMNSVKVDVLNKRQGGVIGAGSIPVVFWFAKQDFVTAQSAPTDPRFQQVLATFSNLYAAVGIRMGPFIYRDLPSAAAERYAVIDLDQPLLGDLFALADQSTDVALNFFMIDQFTLGPGFTVLGIAGGIPGPPAYPGLGKSGVAIALGVMGNSTERLAQTMAHEAGHYFGLFHTSERTGTSFDPLLDTPECTSRFDENGDGVLSPAECRNQGADNLMFWASSSGRQGTISNDQRFVLFRNPSVQ